MTPVRRAGERGMSLPEVLVALTLLASTLIGVMPLFTGAVATNESANQLGTVNTLAREKLEELSSYPRSDPRLVVPDGANAAVADGVAAPPGSISAANKFCNNDLPTWYRPVTGETSLAAGKPGPGWFRFPYSRTYTVEQFGPDLATRVTGPAEYTVKLVTVTVAARKGTLAGKRQTTQSLYLRRNNES